jgi:hypothetical protein
VRVVVYHVFGWAWLTILLPAMGLMFALAGSLMAGSLDRTEPAAVRRRLRRLLPPVWAFGAVSVALMMATGWRTAPPTALGWGELLWWGPAGPHTAGRKPTVGLGAQTLCCGTSSRTCGPCCCPRPRWGCSAGGRGAASLSRSHNLSYSGST